jgi:hypothetical protein
MLLHEFSWRYHRRHGFGLTGRYKVVFPLVHVCHRISEDRHYSNSASRRSHEFSRVCEKEIFFKVYDGTRVICKPTAKCNERVVMKILSPLHRLTLTISHKCRTWILFPSVHIWGRFPSFKPVAGRSPSVVLCACYINSRHYLLET